MNMKKQHYKPLVLTFLLILTCLLFVGPQSPVHIVEVYATTPVEEPEYFRGPNYETLSYPNGTTLWESASQYVWNGSAYVPYIINNTYASKGYITVQAGLIGAELHKGKIVYYDPNMTTLAVGRENWVVFEKVDADWKPVCASLEKYFDSMFLTEESEYVNVTATWTTPKGDLTIVYHFEENLKRTVTFDPIDDGQYAVAQIWNNTQYEKVRLTNAMIIKKNDNVVVGKSDALTVLFHNDVQPFGIMEDQTLAEDKLKYVIFAGGTVNYQGFSITDAVAWIFGTWTLNSNETLTIDPTTSTFYTGSGDGHVSRVDADWDTCHDATWGSGSQTDYEDFYVGSDYSTILSSFFIHRAYLPFDTSSLPDDVLIQSAILNISVYDVEGVGTRNFSLVQTSQPSTYLLTNDDFELCGAIDNPTEGADRITITSTGWKCWTLNATGLAWISKTGWTKLGIRTGWLDCDDVPPENDVQEAYIYCDSSESTAPPQLKVTWTTDPTINEFEAPSTVYAHDYFFLNATINDLNGVTDFLNATIELNGTIILKWTNATNTFSEESDPSNYCLLNASACVRTTVNSTAYKLSWYIHLAWNYTEGSISILLSDTTVYDGAGGSDSGSQADLFTFEDDLIMSSASVDPVGIYINENVDFSGTIYWEGTSTPPSDTTGITAKVELGSTEKASTTTIDANGQWTATVQAPSTPDTYSYNIYALTDETSTQNQSVDLIVMKRASSGGVVGPYEPSPPVERDEEYVYVPPDFFGPEPITGPDIEWGLPALVSLVIGLGVIGYVSQKIRRSESRANLLKRRTTLKRGNQRREYAKRTKTKRKTKR